MIVVYCLLEIKSAVIREPHWIEKEQYYSMLKIKTQAHDLLDAVELFSFVTEAYDDLKNWCITTDTNAEYIMTNKHTAERKCRGILLELKTYFLQMEAKIIRKYGENSAIHNLFVTAKDDAKRTDASFSLAMDLKECANHCNEIVHSFSVTGLAQQLHPCCIPSKLLSDYDSWTKKNRKYLASLTCNIDLLIIFESVYNVLGEIQKKLISHLLSTDNIKDGLLELRAFMDNHFTKENYARFHLAQMVYTNGKDAPKVSFFQNKVPVNFNAYPIDWRVIYELTDLLME